MGMINPTENEIVIDAVLTELGRELLSRQDGSFDIVKFALGDDEFDYTRVNASGSTISAIFAPITNTPVFQASTNENMDIKNKLVSVSKRLFTFPTLRLSTPDSRLDIRERDNANTPVTVVASQQFLAGTSNQPQVMDAELTDPAFIVTVRADALALMDSRGRRLSPVQTSKNGLARYIVRASGLNNQYNTAFVNLNFVVPPLSNRFLDNFFVGTAPRRTFDLTARVEGVSSGASAEIDFRVAEQR